jgi:hypothetical protein
MDNDEKLQRALFRIGDLERHLSEYEEMLENQMQWQAERVVTETISLVTIILLGVGSFAYFAFIKWLEIDASGWIGVLIGLGVFVVWAVIGSYVASFRDKEVARLPQPWKYVHRPKWRQSSESDF